MIAKDRLRYYVKQIDWSRDIDSLQGDKENGSHSQLRERTRSWRELVQPRGFWLGFYQRKPPRAAPVKSYPQLKGVGTCTGNGPLAVVPHQEWMEPFHNRDRYILHGPIQEVSAKYVWKPSQTRHRRSSTGVPVGPSVRVSRKPPTEAHLITFSAKPWKWK